MSWVWFTRWSREPTRWWSSWQLYISSSLGGAVYLIDWKTGATLKHTAVVANEGGWVDYIR